jgi:hypothetical protein
MNKDTHDMLARLTALLANHREGQAPKACQSQSRLDALALRKISMTLHRWHELECGIDGGHIERDEATGKPYWVSARPINEGPRREWRNVRTPIADREAGAKRRLARIMAKYPSLSAYVQTDPRGCALYVLRPGDVPAGEDASCYYSRGLAVFK